MIFTISYTADGAGGDFLTTNEMKELGDDSIVPTQASLQAAGKLVVQMIIHLYFVEMI